jgi:hypothetical protein
MKYIKNCKLAVDLNHVFCKMEDIDVEIIQTAGRGIMKRSSMVDMTYMVYHYGEYVIFPE